VTQGAGIGSAEAEILLSANKCRPNESGFSRAALDPLAVLKSIRRRRVDQLAGVAEQAALSIRYGANGAASSAGEVSRTPWLAAAQTLLSRPSHTTLPQSVPAAHAHEVDPLYLFARHVEWERQEEPSAAWELIAAANSSNGETRAQARALLSSSRHLGGIGSSPAVEEPPKPKRAPDTEERMKSPYGLEMIEDCTQCSNTNPSFFCGFSREVRQSLNQVSHKSILPAGAILFVEGQSPRGVFVLCSGKVNLSTTSREGKILILKTAEAGEALGLSAAVSGVNYETTAETATPCQLNFVDRQRFLELLQTHSEVALHTAQCLSRDFQSAYRDIHDLVLTRSSSGKLARLLLAQTTDPQQQNQKDTEEEAAEIRIQAAMTHEEMAQRIGASRETVTRLLSDLKRKQLIRLDGSTLVIRSRSALKALAV
jgi:CRP/FNR family cyclic AMP-dependent transcriptional regulator